MQTTVDKTRCPAQPCDRGPGWSRPIAPRRLIRFLAATVAAVVFSAGVALCQTPSQPPTGGTPSKTAPPKTTKKTSVPANAQPEASQQPSLTAMTLEELLATALKDNPDIRVAEAKLREAETQLSRVRLEVAQKVMVFRNDWAVQKAKIEEYEARLSEVERLFESKAISQEDYRLGRVNVQVNRALLTKLEAELPYLLGRAPQTAALQTQSPVVKVYALHDVSAKDVAGLLRELLGDQKSAVSVGVDDRSNALIVSAPPETQAIIEEVIRKLEGADRRSASRPRALSEMEQKILKALNTPIEASFQDKPLDELLKDFRKSFGIPFVLDPASFGSTPFVFGGGDPNPKVTLELGEVPLAIVLEAIQDTARVYFRVREYGIHVSRNAAYGRDTSGAVDFWRGERQSGEKPPQR